MITQGNKTLSATQEMHRLEIEMTIAKLGKHAKAISQSTLTINKVNNQGPVTIIKTSNKDLNLPYIISFTNRTTTACSESSLIHARKTTHTWSKECFKEIKGISLQEKKINVLVLLRQTEVESL